MRKYRLCAQDLDDMGCEYGNSVVLGVVIPVSSPGYQEEKTHGGRDNTIALRQGSLATNLASDIH